MATEYILKNKEELTKLFEYYNNQCQLIKDELENRRIGDQKEEYLKLYNELKVKIKGKYFLNENDRYITFYRIDDLSCDIDVDDDIVRCEIIAYGLKVDLPEKPSFLQLASIYYDSRYVAIDECTLTCDVDSFFGKEISEDDFKNGLNKVIDLLKEPYNAKQD